MKSEPRVAKRALYSNLHGFLDEDLLPHAFTTPWCLSHLCRNNLLWSTNIKPVIHNWFIIFFFFNFVTCRDLHVWLYKLEMVLRRRNFEFTRSNATLNVTKKSDVRVTRLGRPQYGLIIISDNPFHYADDQRGHVIRLPTVCQSIDRPGKRKWRIKKKESARSAIIITGDGDTGRNTELPAQHIEQLGKGLVASCLNQR